MISLPHCGWPIDCSAETVLWISVNIDWKHMKLFGILRHIFESIKLSLFTSSFSTLLYNTVHICDIIYWRREEIDFLVFTLHVTDRYSPTIGNLFCKSHKQETDYIRNIIKGSFPFLLRLNKLISWLK